MLACGSINALSIVDLQSASAPKLIKLSFPDDRVSSVAYSSDGKKLAAATDTPNGGGHATVWETSNLQSPRYSFVEASKVTTVSFSPDASKLAWGCDDGGIRIIFSNSGSPADVKRIYATYLPITSLAFSPDGKHLASASTDSTARIWRLNEAAIRPVRAPANSRSDATQKGH